MIVVDQSLSVLQNGIEIKDKISNIFINMSVGSFYHTATITSSINIPSYSEISIIFPDNNLSFFVFTSTKISRGSYTIECRGIGAKMTEPFVSSGEYAVDAADNAIDLCALYASRYGVPISYLSENVFFGGDFVRNGTPLTALASIANVTGSEFYERDGEIVIAQNKVVPQIADHDISSLDIIGYVPFFSTIDNRGIKYITIGSTAEDESQITTEIKCNATVDGCSGEVIARIVPHDSFQSSAGITLHPLFDTINYQTVLAETLTVQLEAEISQITSITINGAPITDYTYTLDTLIFGYKVRGIFAISYIAKGYRGYANIIGVGADKYTEFDIYYGLCEKYSYQDIVNCNGSTETTNCGGVYVEMPSDRNYAKGFTFATIGGSPRFTFYSNTEVIIYDTVKTLVETVYVEKCTLSRISETEYRHLLRFTPSTGALIECRSAGVDIFDFTLDTATNELVFEAYHSAVVCAYDVDTVSHFVQFENRPDEDVKMIVSGDLPGDCDFALSGYDYDSTSSTECVEGITVPINMIKELEVTPMQASTRGCSTIAPNGTVLDLNTDRFGILRIPSVQFGTYTTNCHYIKPNTTMKIKSGG